MNQDLLDSLREITPEERAILDGNPDVQRSLYTSGREFVIDSRKLLERGELIEIRPHTRFARFPRHRHNYVEMVYLCSGAATHIINGTEMIVLSEGDLLILNQNVYHEILPASEHDIAVNFIILPEFFDRALVMMEQENILRDFLIAAVSQEASKTGYLLFHTRGLLPVQNLIENMIWTIRGQIPGSFTAIQTTMGLLFLNLSLATDALNRENPDQYEQNTVFSILKYIETRYKDGSLAEISEQLHLPDYAVSRLLKKHTGNNFKELLQTKKLRQAAWLLKNTPLPTEKIIRAVGYSNSSYFHRRFKETYHCTPKEYRRT